MSWDGTNTPWAGSAADKVYLQSGQFTSTLKTSQSLATWSGTGFGSGVGTDDNNARLGIAGVVFVPRLALLGVG